jgi:anti-sigma B factor antagonist
MLIEHSEVGRVTVIRPMESRIDAARAPDFKAEVICLIEEGRQAIVLDLSGVDFIDSSGLGALVGCLKRLGQRGDLALAGAKKPVEKVLALTRMDKVFRIFKTTDEAVSTLNG